MQWIRNLEALQEDEVSVYNAEFEIASESRVLGVLDYRDGAILCGPMTFHKDSRGLFKYLLKIKYPLDSGDFERRKATRKGYLFRDGIPGELISILSFFFQCRFFLVAAYSGDLTSSRVKLKYEYSPQIRTCRPYFDPDMFPGGDRSFQQGLSVFLDSLIRIDPKYHQSLILGFHNYARALREFGIDEEMVFVRLVSSIEAFADWAKLGSNEDPLSVYGFDDIIQPGRLSASAEKELKSLFNVRKAKAKFKAFIERYSKGFFKGGKLGPMRIKKADLPKALNAIYNSRSAYLHRGEIMYLSRHMRDGQHWDTDPTVGMIIDNRLFPENLKLPYGYFFQRLVRHCIMGFVSEVSDK